MFLDLLSTECRDCPCSNFRGGSNETRTETCQVHTVLPSSPTSPTNPAQFRRKKQGVPLSFMRSPTKLHCSLFPSFLLAFFKANRRKLGKRVTDKGDRLLGPGKHYNILVDIYNFSLLLLGNPPLPPLCFCFAVFVQTWYIFSRFRVDAEATVRVRREQFRLRCKTKWERRRKAEEVRHTNASGYM